jgi:hypothetical protein
MKIYISDLRQTGMCARGSRAFFLRHDLDWQDFLANGIDLETAETFDDTMVRQVVEYVKNGRQQ